MALPRSWRLPALQGPSIGGTTLKPTRFFLCLAAACLLLAASHSVAQDNVLGLPPKAIRNQGSLVICGGGDVPDAVFKRFIELAGGAEARLIVVPTAARFDNYAAIKRHYEEWRQFEITSLDFLDTDSRDDADDMAFVEPLRRATGVWIAGGEQGRLTDIYGGTQVEKAILAVVERGGVVGGISAGAAIMSKTMIRYGKKPDDVVTCDGFGLLTRAVVDQHFSQRKRLDRLIAVLYDQPSKLGLGIDENTALVLRGDRLSVLGESSVTICMAAAENRPQWVRKLRSGEDAKLTFVTGKESALETVRLKRVGKTGE